MNCWTGLGEEPPDQAVAGPTDPAGATHDTILGRRSWRPARVKRRAPAHGAARLRPRSAGHGVWSDPPILDPRDEATSSARAEPDAGWRGVRPSSSDGDRPPICASGRSGSPRAAKEVSEVGARRSRPHASRGLGTRSSATGRSFRAARSCSRRRYVQEAREQPRLADPRLALDEHRRRRPASDRTHQPAKLLQLPVAPDQRVARCVRHARSISNSPVGLTSRTKNPNPRRKPSHRPVDHGLLAVDAQLEALLDIACDALHGPLARPSAPNVDPSVVGIAHEPQPAYPAPSRGHRA